MGRVRSHRAAPLAESTGPTGVPALGFEADVHQEEDGRVVYASSAFGLLHSKPRKLLQLLPTPPPDYEGGHLYPTVCPTLVGAEVK